ncbi:MAG: CpaF family protein [Planctomycetaceae bacterium]
MVALNSRFMQVENGNGQVDPDELRYQKIKVMIHEELVDALELSMLALADNEQLSGEVRLVAQDLCREHGAGLESVDRERLIDDIMDEVFGLGPLESLMKDKTISDILVNNIHEVYIERRGRLELTPIIFADEAHLMRIIQRIVSRVGRRIDEVSPMVDARLPDGSRVNAIVPPLALNGPTLSIRRFGARPLQVDDLLENGSMTTDMVDFLSAAIDARMSVMVAGGTGAGKTTMLNALTRYIPRDERIITIEDSAELQLQHPHVIRLETRPPNTEGTGEISPRALVRNSLRMRPDRIIVGEVRGPEALDMLQAMNTGHEGSLTTIHSNDTFDALSRLELMVAMTGYDLPIPVVRQYIVNGIRLIVHLARLKGGQRRVMRIAEITGVEKGDIQLQDIYGFQQTGVDEQGIAQGEFYVTGYRPKCLDNLKAAGVQLSDKMFEKRRIPLKMV